MYHFVIVGTDSSTAEDLSRWGCDAALLVKSPKNTPNRTDSTRV
jgi:hypothetical protein